MGVEPTGVPALLWITWNSDFCWDAVVEKGSGRCLRRPEQESAMEFGLGYGEAVQGSVSDGNSKMQGCQFCGWCLGQH